MNCTACKRDNIAVFRTNPLGESPAGWMCQECIGRLHDPSLIDEETLEVVQALTERPKPPATPAEIRFVHQHVRGLLNPAGDGLTSHGHAIAERLRVSQLLDHNEQMLGQIKTVLEKARFIRGTTGSAESAFAHLAQDLDKLIA